MTPGTVLCDPNFEFHDGSKAQKLFVLLTDRSAGYYVVAKTTSKDHRYNVTQQCQVTDRFPNYFVSKYAQVFERHTWIQFDSFYKFSVYWLEDQIVQNNIWQVAHAGALTQSILACAKDAQDLLGEDKEMIEQSLRTLIEANTNS